MLPMKEAVRKADGNAEVIALLTRWLERAKVHGQMGFVAIVSCDNLKHVVTDSAGSLQLCFAANWGLDTLKYQLAAQAHGRHAIPYDPLNADQADRICYDITAGPACYDFISWLVLAEMNRRKCGAPAPLKVGFKMTDTPEERKIHEELRKDFYRNVIFPSLSFVGAVPDEGSNASPTCEKYTIRPVKELADNGQEVPLLVPSKMAVDAIHTWLYSFTDRRAPVTITLREAGYWEFRNSNIPEWLKVAQYLKNRGERVIFIRDTANADQGEDFHGYPTATMASKDVHARLALYEAAKCNLFVSNGPWMLALHGSRPWLMFVETNSMSPFFPETPQFWTQWHGLHEGQFCWSKPTQRIVWKRDSADNVIEAWNKLAPALEPIVEAAE